MLAVMSTSTSDPGAVLEVILAPTAAISYKFCLASFKFKG
jgi:hypothetical protein